jgi:outer membrane protein OmpA-like peptidoglycan-associated protein
LSAIHSHKEQHMKKFLLFAFLLPFTWIQAQTAVLVATKEMALLKVIVKNANNSSSEGEKISFLAEKTQKIYGGVTDVSGKFSILVPSGDKYKVKYKLFTEDKYYAPLDIPKTDGPTEMELTINVSRPKIYTLDNVSFDTGKSTLRPQSNKALDELAELLTMKKKMKIEIAGHTDNVGIQAGNQKLSEERAGTVRAYLLKKGIAADRVMAKGYGDSMPIADNSTPEGKQQNRRTEVRIISE